MLSLVIQMIDEWKNLDFFLQYAYTPLYNFIYIYLLEVQFIPQDVITQYQAQTHYCLRFQSQLVRWVSLSTRNCLIYKAHVFK